ncbi:hypothetical protein [Cellulomonas cellasea]|uniref:Uncharacterized protein n=2 Tax=Cellulomonas cellasea TaxID=43670 RepID=A0A0A0B6A3_9CELL|nr:hypothetical protein [Cellulomonas cellasea]KGM02355.1 hypothetical protein Q760_14025 [Cellulomonas cellasea DSM 20118]GEA89447.1 hypothetical protein CCE01nite_33960 [Cellulomonas cellasea]
MSTTSGSGGARPWTQRIGVVALVLAALATGRAITHSFPVEGRIEAPFVRDSAVGEPVRLRYADVEAGEPAGARELDAGGTTLTSPGVWLVVPVRMTARGEPRTLAYAAVRGSDGTLYVAGGFGRGGFAPGTAQPGVPREADVAVELPADAVAGAHLLLALDPDDHRRDDLADIDLGLTQADVERWTDGAPPVTFRDAADAGATASADASGDGS